MRNPIDRMLSVLMSSATANDDERHVGAERVVAPARQHHQRERDGREEQLHEHVRASGSCAAAAASRAAA